MSTTSAQGPSFGVDSSVPDFNSETYRLIRDDWSDQGITTFSQEVWALMQLLQDYNTTGTSTYNQTSPTAPVTINQPFNLPASPAIVINQLDQAGQPIAAEQITIGPDGIMQGGEPIEAVGGTGGFIGIIGAQVSPSTYKVTLTTAGGALVVTATVGQIDPSATIPAGTSVIVVQVGTVYYFQVPVWM
jgi:hypothetical protein